MRSRHPRREVPNSRSPRLHWQPFTGVGAALGREPALVHALALGLALALVASCGSGGSDESAAPPAQDRAALEVVASETAGDALAATASADGSLVVLGEGATLTVMDAAALAAGAPTVLARAPITAAPYALVCEGHEVFVAGGTAGLWLVTIGDGAAVATRDGAWPAEVRVLDTHGAACLDVARIDGHPAGPLVAAVTSARPGFGVSELFVLDRAAPHALRARVPLVPSGSGAGAKAFALVSDPGDATRVYVAMGSAGVWRVDLADLAAPSVVPGPVFDRPNEMLDGEPAQARDLACVRAAGRALVYAAIDRGGLAQLEVTDPAAFGPALPVTRAVIECSVACGQSGTPYGFRVAAAGGPDGRVLVALGTNIVPAQKLESGPFATLGRWNFDLSLPEPPDAPAGCTPGTYLLRADATGPVAFPVVLGTTCRAKNVRTIDLVARAGGALLLEGRWAGATALQLPANVWTAGSVSLAPPAPPYASVGLGCIDGTASAEESGLLYFGVDGISALPMGLPRFDASHGSLTVVEGTQQLCPTSVTQFCNAPESTVVPPNPWTNGLTGGARWSGASDPGREWFASGKTRVSQQCPVDPCAWTDDWCLDPWREEGDAPNDDHRPPGWEIVRLDSAAAPAGADAMDMGFWSIAAPSDALGRTGRNYFGSAIDATAPEGGRLLHLFRGAIRDGYLVCSADEVVDLALGSCPQAFGRGQRLTPSWLHVLRTHFELGLDDDPFEALTWRGEAFALDVAGEERRYLAVAAGWIVPVGEAPWNEHADRAQVVVYDVTDVGPTSPPVLARILLGPREPFGNAVALRCARVGGRTWMFVADLGGAVHAFDVSPDALLELAGDPSQPANALESATSWFAPLDAWDGERANVTDLELDVDTDPARPVVLLANARRGIAVLDVDAADHGASVTLTEAEGSPLDTPGIASGIVPIRRAGQTWYAIGDARCGVRIVQRTQ